MSWNDLEIRARGKFSYKTPVDECKVSFSISSERFREEISKYFFEIVAG
jgi:hypothetical protein